MTQVRVVSLGVLVGLTAVVAPAGAAEPPRVVRHLTVYAEPGRFAGWPANHGIWQWGDEVLVGFSRGYYKDLGPSHHIDREKPEECLLARSKDGGLTWKVETPSPTGALNGAPGSRHGTMPPGLPPERTVDLREPIDFTHPNLALTFRMEGASGGGSRFSYSYDRGAHWRGPFRLPMFGQPGVMARTDYLVNGPADCLVFLTAAKANGKEGRPFAARTTDGGLSWTFLGFIGPEPTGYAIMPSTVRVGPTDLLTTIRRADRPKSWIDAHASHDDGRTWSLVSTPEPDTGEGNPPSLLTLKDGRLCLVYGRRAAPFGIRARFSADKGTTWSKPFVLRDDGGGRDLGYVRAVVRPNGRVLAVYYYTDKSGPDRYLAATLFDPGTP